MALAVTFTEPATVNTTEDIQFTGAVWDSGHSNWVLLGQRSPANVAQVQTSPDTTTWTIRNMPSTAAYRAIAYASTLGAAGRLVAMGNGVSAWSDDGGATWTAATSLPSANSYWDVKWWPAQAIFVACSSNGASRIATSADGKSWTDQTAASALAWSGLEVSATVAVCVAFLSGSTSTQLIQTSTDGVTWTLQTHTAIETRRGIVAGGQRLGIGYSDDLDMFLIAGNDGVNGTRAWRSTNDGVTWTASDAIPTIGDDTNRGFFWLDAADSWYLSCANFNYGESTDGVTWTTTAMATTNGGYTPVGWRDTGVILGGSTLGYDVALVGAVTLVPTVTGISPSSGTTLGGTAVTITGTNFSGSPVVTLGGLAATSVVVVNTTTITANSPAHAAGVVDVGLTGAVTLSAAYTYVQAPSLDYVIPAKGPTTGGLNVTLRGVGFTGKAAADITFDGVAVTNLSVTSDIELRCMPAAHAAGFVDVVVAGCGTLAAGYRYQINSSRATIQNVDAPNLPPIPEPTAPVDARTGKIHQDWLMWLNTLKLRVEADNQIDAASIISGTFDPDMVPDLPFTRVQLDNAPRLLGRTTAGAGDAEEIRAAGGLVLGNGILSVAGLAGGYVVGDLLYADSANTLARLADVAAGSYLRSGGVATAPLWSTLKLPNAATSGDILKASGANTYASAAPQALTKVDDTNVTLTLGGTPASALVNAASLTLGWTGTLAAARLNANVVQSVVNDTNVTGSIAAQALTLGWTGTLSVARGGTGAGSAFTAGSVVFAGASGVYSQDNANLFWDDSNNRLGIGNAAPVVALDVTGAIAVNPGTFFSAIDSTAIFLARGSGSASAYFYLDPAAQVYLSSNTAATALSTTKTSLILNWRGFRWSGAVSLPITATSAVFPSATIDSSFLAFGFSDNDSQMLNLTHGTKLGLGTTNPTARFHIMAGTATANTAPLKLTSGTNMTAAEAGAIEFTTDDFFATITTGAARKAFVLDDGTRLTSGKIPIATTNGRLIDLTASSAYTPTNVSTDRAYDANATTLDELADVVGTIIADLQTKGILG